MKSWLVGALVVCTSSARAEAPDASAKERLWPELGLQVHYSQWEGPYSQHGTGGRFRWEPLAWLGVEGTFEALIVDAEGGGQINIPLGSQVYFPWEIVPRLRTRAMIGLCAMLSLSRGATPHASDSDDIQLGFKAGAGMEYALGAGWTVFSDLAWQRYTGHARRDSVWGDGLEGELVATDQLTFALGLGIGL